MTEPRKYRVTASIVVRDPDGRVLLLCEADPRVYGKVNLPGGHLSYGESVVECAIREFREETGFIVNSSGLLGVYLQGDGINFVFHGNSSVTATKPGQAQRLIPTDTTLTY